MRENRKQSARLKNWKTNRKQEQIKQQTRNQKAKKNWSECT